MGFLTVLIYLLLSFAVGGFFIGLSLDKISIYQLTGYVHTNILSDPFARVILGLSGLVVVLFSLRYIEAYFRRSQRDKSIIFEYPEGKVSITLFALEDMLKRMLEEHTEVTRIRPKVLLKKQAIIVNTKGVLTAEVNLVDFTKEIQEKIKEKMSTLLGEDKEVKVNLIIRKVSLGGKKSAAEEPEPEVPFRNY